MTATTLVTRRRFIPHVRGGIAPRVAALILCVLVGVTLLAPWIAPHDPNQGDLLDTLSGSNADHLLGTDKNGRDVLSRLIYGGRSSFLGPLAVTALATAIGVPLGLISGYVGGIVDATVSRVFDVILSFPAIVLAVLLIATLRPGFTSAVIAVTIVHVPLLARVVRGATIVQRSRPYVLAADAQGFGPLRIMFRHITPNILGIVAAQCTLNFGYALLDLAGLSYLGLGVQPPTADWGQMLVSGQDGLVLGVYSEIGSAAMAILITVVAVNLLGDALARRAEEGS